MRISDNPSILAASIMSCGNDLALCLNIIIRNGVEIVGRMNPIVVFSQPAFENIWNSGIMVATKGTIIASRIMLISVSFALSWKISNP